MEYPLPQFLSIKPKVAGPLRFRELVYVVVGSLFSAIFYFILPSVIQFLLLAIPIMIITLVLAFGKIKGFPMPIILMRSFFFLFSSKKYIWQKVETPAVFLPKAKKEKEEEIQVSPATLKIAEKSRLKEISKLIEIHPK